MTDKSKTESRKFLDQVTPIIWKALYELALQQSENHHDAEDFAQEAFLRISKTRDYRIIELNESVLETASVLFKLLSRIGKWRKLDRILKLKIQGQEPYHGPYLDEEEPCRARFHEVKPISSREYLGPFVAGKIPRFGRLYNGRSSSCLDYLVEEENILDLERFVNALPAELRRAVVCFYSDNDEYEDERGTPTLAYRVRKELGINMRTFDRRLARAKDKIEADYLKEKQKRVA